MRNRFKYISISWLAACSVYWLYALIAVPLIEPPVKRRAGSGSVAVVQAEQTARRQHLTQLAALFPPDAWELDEPKVVETDQGIFLFRDYKPQPNGEMELKPCTLVFFSSGTKRAGGQYTGRPFVMSAPGGALLQFDGDSDTLRGEFGKLRGGKLPGEIRIFSPETAPGAADQLEINTRNIQIDEQKISTLHEVDFRFGHSFGNGRDLMIELAPPQNTGRTKQNLGPSIGGVKSLELVHVDKFHLHVPPRNVQSDIESTNNAAASTASRAIFQGSKETTLEVTCRGSFLFDFDEPSASFADHVDVVRLATDGPSDQLNCQLLTVFFADPPARSRDNDESENRVTSQPRESSFAIERIAAEGQPAILRAPSVGATARGDYLEYNLKTRRVLLGPVPESRIGSESAKHSQTASLEHEQSHVIAPRIEYEIPEDPKRLGRIWADGPGQLSGKFGKEQPQTLEASWGEKLYVRPYEGNQVISLTSGTKLRFGPDNHFAAQELHVWLYEVPTAETGEPEGVSPRTVRYTLVPDRLLALGDVVIDSTKFAGQTQRVEAWFDQDPHGLTNGGTTSNASLSNSPLKPQPEPLGNQPPAQKFDVSGKVVRVQMRRVGSKTVVKDATVEGNVALADARIAGADFELPPQLKITGNSLNISDADTNGAVIHIQGSPAQVVTRGLSMSGAAIHLQQSENRLWIDGAGQMTIPIPNSLKKKSAGEPLYQNRPTAQVAEPTPKLTVDWKGRMIFDGTTAHFEQSVETRGKQWVANGEQIELLAMGSTLDVRLNQRVDFTHPPTDGEVGLSRLTYGGSVLFTSRTMKEGGQIAFDQMQINNLTLEQQPNSPQPNLIHGEGPGWLSTVRFGNDPLAAPVASQPAALRPRLAYLYVQFARGLEGDLVKKQITFLEQVKAVYGPVNSWEDQLPLDPRSLGEDGVLLTCQRLTLAEMPGYLPNQRAMELEANGNATVEGKQFAARGGRISYSQAKDMLTLEGDVRSEAELWKLPRKDQVKPDAIARKIMFWRRENRVEVDGARYVDLSRFGNSQGR